MGNEKRCPCPQERQQTITVPFLYLSYLHRYLRTYNRLLCTNLIITTNQSGIRPGDSVTNQLIYLFIVHELINVLIVMKTCAIDLFILLRSKTFDNVWHERLIFERKQHGVTGNLLKLLTKSVSNRKKKVMLNGMDSEWGLINSRVPSVYQ